METLKKVDNDNNLKNIIDDFVNALGYDNEPISEVLRIYNACKDTSNILHKIFTSEEIEEIEKELEERGF